MTTGIVLCGGRSTRMGRDKASLPFGDETLLARVVRLVGESVDHVIVVARDGQDLGDGRPAADQGGGNPFLVHQSATREGGLGLPVQVTVIRDPVDDLGPLAALALGLQASTTELNFVTACDMPLIRPAVIRRLLTLLGDADACVPVDGEHVMVLCAVYRRSLAAAAGQLVAAGQLRVRTLLEGATTRRVDTALFRDIDPQLDSFFSCDTPEAYEWARTGSATRP